MLTLGVGIAGLDVILLIPLRGLFICPLAVAGLAKRYLCTVRASKFGAPCRNAALIAFINDVMGGLLKLSCANLTLFILVVLA